MFDPSKNAELSVEGMTCGHCQQRVNKALLAVKGVKSAAVDLQTGRATVVFNEKKTGSGQLAQAVQAAGYRVTDVKLG